MGPKTSYRWAYNPYKWPCRWVSGFVTPLVTGFLGAIILYPGHLFRIAEILGKHNHPNRQHFPSLMGGELLAPQPSCVFREKKGGVNFSAGNERRLFWPDYFLFGNPQKKRKEPGKSVGTFGGLFFLWSVELLFPSWSWNFPRLKQRKCFWLIEEIRLTSWAW